MALWFLFYFVQLNTGLSYLWILLRCEFLTAHACQQKTTTNISDEETVGLKNSSSSNNSSSNNIMMQQNRNMIFGSILVLVAWYMILIFVIYNCLGYADDNEKARLGGDNLTETEKEEVTNELYGAILGSCSSGYHLWTLYSFKTAGEIRIAPGCLFLVFLLVLRALASSQ